MKLTKQIYGYICYFILLFVPIAIFRDFTPLNELKYLSISNEMVKKGYFFILKNHGEIYSDKPPLYFWIINLEKFIFREHSMLAVSLISIIPAFFIVIIMNKWVKNNLSKEESVLGTLMLITTGVFMVAAFMLRMDMLMSLFITLSLFCFYRVYNDISKNKKLEAYLIYIFIFLGVFTKGPMGIIIPLLSMLLFILFNRKKGIIKEIKLFKGILILLGLFVVWFGFVFYEGGKDYLYQLVYKQTVNRGIKSFSHASPFYYYLKTIIYTFAPWTLFYFYGIYDAVKNYKKLEEIEKFFLIIILSTFIFLSFVSGKLDIYLLPLYSFLPFLSLMRWKKSKNRKKIMLFALSPFALILGIATLIGPTFMKKSYTLVSYSPVVMYLASLSFIISIIYLVKENQLKATKAIYAGFVLLFLFVVINITQINDNIGLKKIAKEISLELKNGEYNIYSYQRNDYRNIDVFLGRDVGFISIPEELYNIINEKSDKPKMIIGLKENFEVYKKEHEFGDKVKIIYNNQIIEVLKVDK